MYRARSGTHSRFMKLTSGFSILLSTTVLNCVGLDWLESADRTDKKLTGCAKDADQQKFLHSLAVFLITRL